MLALQMLELIASDLHTEEETLNRLFKNLICCFTVSYPEEFLGRAHCVLCIVHDSQKTQFIF